MPWPLKKLHLFLSILIAVSIPPTVLRSAWRSLHTPSAPRSRAWASDGQAPIDGGTGPLVSFLSRPLRPVSWRELRETRKQETTVNGQMSHVGAAALHGQ